MPTSRKTTVCPTSSCSVPRVDRRSPTERQHAVVLGHRAGHLGPLERPEGRLAVLDEDVGDRAALRGLDGGVGVVQRHPQQLGQRGPHGALARPGRPDEHDARHQSSQVRIEAGMAAR